MTGLQAGSFSYNLVAALNVLALHDHILTGNSGKRNDGRPALGCYILLPDDRVRSVRDRCAGEDTDGLFAADQRKLVASGRGSPDDAQPAGGVLRAESVAVKGALVKGRNGKPGIEVPGKHAVERVGKSDRFCLRENRKLLKQTFCFLHFNMLFHRLSPLLNWLSHDCTMGRSS